MPRGKSSRVRDKERGAAGATSLQVWPGSREQLVRRPSVHGGGLGEEPGAGKWGRGQ